VGHWLLLLPIGAVAVLTVRDDLREGRIYNHRLLQGLAAGAAAYLLLLLLEAAGAPPILCAAPIPGATGHWGLAVLLDLVVGLAVAVGLWLLRVWAAGDAKLFALYAFLVPPSCYTLTWLPGFPALPLLVNVFAVVFAFLAGDLARTGLPRLVRGAADPRRRAAALAAVPGALPRVIPLVLAITAMFAGIRALREASREGLEPLITVGDFTMFLVLFALFRPLSRVIATRWGAVVFTVASLGALIFLGQRHGTAALPGLILPSALAVLLVLFARAYPAWGSITRRLRVGDLRPGLVLGAESLQRLRAREEEELAQLGDAAPPPGAEEPGTTPRPTRLGPMAADGLSAEQIRYVRTRYDDDEAIAVERTLPFSPFLAAGALLTFFLGGSLSALLMR